VDLRRGLLEIMDGVAELPPHKFGLVSQSCSDSRFIRVRLGLERELQLCLQVFNLEPGARQMIVRPVLRWERSRSNIETLLQGQ